MTDFVVFEDAESLVDTTRTADIFRVKDVAHILGIEPIEVVDDSIRFKLHLVDRPFYPAAIVKDVEFMLITPKNY